MKLTKNIYIILLLTLMFSLDASGQKTYYSDDNLDWKKDSISSGTVDYTVYLIGDAGEADFSKPSALKLLSSQLKTEVGESTVVFLGDNIYPRGMPELDSPKRKNAELNLEVQVEISNNYNGNIYFIPGNHDWDQMGKKGREAIKREEKFVEESLNSGNTFLPDNACPGPVKIKLNDDVILVLIDTQWWLHKWDKPYGDKDSCESRNEFEFIEKLKTISRKNMDKQIILAGHHPFYSNGNHGGHFTIKDHIFPLTKLNKNLVVPLPVIGSIYPLYRKFISPLQDINHPRYQLLKDEILNAFDGHENFIYAAGHEHNLQYFNKNDQHFIVSGSGSKTKHVAKKHGADFTVSEQGFSKVIYYDSGETWIEYWVVSENDENVGNLIFRKKIKESIEDVDEFYLKEVRPDFSDSTILIAANEALTAGRLKQTFLGKHHREAWTTPIEVEILDMSTFSGGLYPIKLGGGMQTKSLRLENAKGKEFVFRSIQKDPTKVFLSKELQKTWIAGFMKDQVSLSHPYGAIIIPDLAEAAGVLHKKSKLVYIPDDERLGEFRDTYKNTLVIVEERASKNLSKYENFDFAKKAISTPDLIKQLHASHNNVVDEHDMLKNRLFDMLIGDFDRHDDQWRWAEFDCKKGKHGSCYHNNDKLTGKGSVYRAIPRDRDQVFVNMDGIIPSILTFKWAPGRLIRDFDYEIHDIVGLNLNGRQLDKTFLSRLSKEDWVEIAEELKRNITDEVIEKSVNTLPEKIYNLQGKEISDKLKKRRDDLVKYAEMYYLILAKEVNVIGSNESELFEVHRVSNGNTIVKVFKTKKRKIVLYQRTFKKDETDEIRLYALGGDDHIELFGNVKEGIKIRVIGGEGNDIIKDFSTVKGLRKYTKVYDETTGTQLVSSKETKNHTSDTDKEINIYERFKFYPNIAPPIVKMGYNVDDGLFLGGGVTFKKHGWRKAPYAYTQKLVSTISPTTSAFQFLYEGDFYQISKKWNLHLMSEVKAPNSTTNYFGLGNETNLLDSNVSFYQLRYDHIEVSTLIGKNLDKNQTFKIGLRYDYVKIEDDSNRYTNSQLASLNESDFEQTHLYGAKFIYEINTLNHKVLPSKGVKLKLVSDWIYNSTKNSSISKIKIDFQFAKKFNFIFKPTIAVRAGGATIFDDFSFYQANTLGAQNRSMGRGNLRGYHRDRFSGRSLAYQNAELRLDLFNFQSYLFPGQFGVLGFTDNGRVWMKNDNSNRWHQSYGGGVWLGILKTWVLVATYEKSNEGELINFHASFFF